MNKRVVDVLFFSLVGLMWLGIFKVSAQICRPELNLTLKECLFGKTIEVWDERFVVLAIERGKMREEKMRQGLYNSSFGNDTEVWLMRKTP